MMRHCLQDRPSEQVRNLFFRHIVEVFIHVSVLLQILGCRKNLFLFHFLNQIWLCMYIKPRRLISWINFPFCTQPHKRPDHKGVSVDLASRNKLLSTIAILSQLCNSFFGLRGMLFSFVPVQNWFRKKIECEGEVRVVKRCKFTVFSFQSYLYILHSLLEGEPVDLLISIKDAHCSLKSKKILYHILRGMKLKLKLHIKWKKPPGKVECLLLIQRGYLYVHIFD